MTVEVEEGRVASTERIGVDADTHFWQERELWRQYIDPEHESAVLAFDDVADPMRDPTLQAAIQAKLEERRSILAADDPVERLKWMDSENLHANVIYPAAGWFSYAADEEVAVAGCRALNRWAAAFADLDRSRLRPAMMLPLLFPKRALEEYRYAHDDLGLKIVFAAPTPHKDRRWSDPDFDPLWEAIQDEGDVLTFHEFSRLDSEKTQTVARPAYRDSYPIRYLCGHCVEAQLALTDMIGGGALERFPELKVGFIEAHVAWVPGWLALMDSIWARISTGFTSTTGTGTLSQSASDIFRRQCFVAGFPDDAWISEMVKYVGANTLVLSTDFPHPNGLNRTPMVEIFRRNHPSLSPDEQQLIISGNAVRIFGLQ